MRRRRSRRQDRRASRPRGDYPAYEIDSIDRHELSPQYNPDGSIRVAAKTLDEIAIVHTERPQGYHVGDLEEARDRFIELHEVDTDWREASDD